MFLLKMAMFKDNVSVLSGDIFIFSGNIKRRLSGLPGRCVTPQKSRAECLPCRFEAAGQAEDG